MIDVSKVEKLMALMGQYGIDVIQVEEGGERIGLAKKGAQLPSTLASGNSSFQGNSSGLDAQSAAHAAFQSSAPVSRVEEGPKAAAPVPAKVPDGITINSPFVGTVYRSPSPDAPAFVQVGSRVRKGQTLCIVEAMKIMNEIESEVDGEIVAVLCENAKPVEFGTPLFVVKA